MSNLELKDVTIEYSSGGYAVRPIDSLDLSVPSGQLVLLLGASGCGKTTLLSALAAILHPASGSIRLDGREVTELRGNDLLEYRRRSVGIVFQAFNLVPSLSALDNVAVPMWAVGVRARAARQRAAALLDRVGLSDRARHRPGDLSGGQQQRVAIARALANDPPVVLADEPTAHLDYIQVESVLQLLRELAAPGRLLVVATHDERMLPLADRVVALSPKARLEERPPETRRVAEGDVLFRQGDESDVVFVVEEGRIAIVRDLADGGEEQLTVVDPGGYFGELGPLFGLRRSATARAIGGPAVVTGLSVPEFRRRTTHEPPAVTGGSRP
jgi:putative ABC transport system ATP-binding protein